MSRVLLQMLKTTSIKEGRNSPRRNCLGLVLIALKLMCPLNLEPMRLPIFNRWLVFYGGFSNLVVLTSQWKIRIWHQLWPFLVKVISKSCFKCLPFWITSIMLLWSLTQLNLISMSQNSIMRTGKQQLMVNVKRKFPPNAPQFCGIGFIMRAFADYDHVGYSITCRSPTGLLIFLNCAPIFWFSTKQTNIDTISFGYELVAMKQCCEYVCGIRNKLRMMGITV